MENNQSIKILANYLPQFHETEENDKWWGKGYTDWNAVRNAKPVYQNHLQPKVPMNQNYYDLSKVENIEWQAKLANQYGVYGFAIYHYWFDAQHNLLKTPSELILDNKSININYCFIWDNSSWKRTWGNVKFSNDWGTQNTDNNSYNSDNGILIELKYGKEAEWKAHFDYLLKFFRDKRYIKIDNKPLFGIFNQNNNSSTLKAMYSYWNRLAINSGFDGMYIIGTNNIEKEYSTKHLYNYEPIRNGWQSENWVLNQTIKIKSALLRRTNIVSKVDYDKIWKRIIQFAYHNGNRDILYGAFVNYDDTPRRGNKGRVVVNSSPEKFEKYLEQLIDISLKQNKTYIFLTAWNEWGEGAYLEPDTINGFAYLEALKNAVDKYNK